MEYLRNVMWEQKEKRVRQANADLDCNPSAFFELLCRPALNRVVAASLIANVQIGAPEDQLLGGKKRLLERTKLLLGESEVKEQSPIEWLRWAIEHKELLLGFQQDRDRITQVLLAFDRHRDRGDSGTKSSGRKGENNRSLLLAVAGLLELLLDRKRPSYHQGSAANAIDAKGWHAASATTLNQIFSAANKEAKEASKTARPKPEVGQS